MKIGIDARTVQVTKMAGINTYAFEVINNLKNKVELYIRSKLENETLLQKDNVQVKKLQFPTYRWKFDQLWETTALPFLANNGKPDVFWGPRFFVPPGLKCKSVCTIHDIAFKLIPGLVSTKQCFYFDRLIKLATKHADHFITVSETTKNDFCTHYNVHPEKVSVVYNGYNKIFDEKLSEEYIANVKTKFHIKSDFILFLGTLEPRKNLQRLVHAFLRSEPFKNNTSLVLAGKMGWVDKEFFEFVQPYVKNGKIILTGYLIQKELRALFQSCRFFAFPSVYEGFGIPVLEAMASGAPVLTSNHSSLKEMFSEAAFTVDPLLEDALLEGINHLNDMNTQLYFKQKGTEMVKTFSWEKCALEHEQVFQKVL